MVKQFAIYLFVVGAVAAGTAAHGYVTGRWTDRTAKSEYVMPPIAQAIGEWKGEDLKSSLAGDKHLRNITRKYTHARSGRVFSISLTLGPAGLTSQHTPEYCYPGSGYSAVGATSTIVAPGRTEADGSLRTAVYRKELPGGAEGSRILWAWSTDGKWTAPRYPELQFLGGIALYKLYIVSSDIDRSVEQDAELMDFVKLLLAELRTSLFTPAHG